MKNMFELKMYFDESECNALAQMMKRLTYSDFESLSKNETEKREMIYTCDIVSLKLKELGFDPA